MRSGSSSKGPVKTFVLGVGAQKAGTTWLYRYLQNSGVMAPGLLKEYHVWNGLDIPIMDEHRVKWPLSENIRKEPDHTAELRFLMQKDPQIYFDYFLSLFSDDRYLTADITPAYCALSHERLRFIRNQFMRRGIRCKVVFLIRDPVERILSASRFNLDRKNYREGIRFGEMDFGRAVTQYYKSPHCFLRTNYPKTVRNISSVFPVSDYYFGIFESMFCEKSVRSISDFLGVPAQLDMITKVFNKSENNRDISRDLEQEIRNFYAFVYRYCARWFPLTRWLWSSRKPCHPGQ